MKDVTVTMSLVEYEQLKKYRDAYKNKRIVWTSYGDFQMIKESETIKYLIDEIHSLREEKYNYQKRPKTTSCIYDTKPSKSSSWLSKVFGL